MTPQELKEMALGASKKEYDEVITELKNSAKEGKFKSTFQTLSDGTVELLQKEGYSVTFQPKISSTGRSYWTVSFK